MGIRTIRNGGTVIAYQAIGGTGKSGASQYYSIARYGSAVALLMAKHRASELESGAPRRVYKPRWRNASGIPGLSFEYQVFSDGGVPIAYAVATWYKAGRNCASRFSTQKHGMLGAVELAMRRREAGTGQPLGITTRQALGQMKKGFQ